MRNEENTNGSFTPLRKIKGVYIETDMSLIEQHLLELLVSYSQSKGVGNGVVIEEIVEDNVVYNSGKDLRLLMLECPEIGKEEEHVDTSTHALISKICLIVKPRNDENVRNLDCDNKANAFSFRNLIEDFDIEMYNVANKHENVNGIHEQTVGDIHEIVHTASDIDEKVKETLMDDDLFQQDSVVGWQQDPYHISRMDADRIYDEFGTVVIDMDDLHSGDEGDDKHPPETRKRILREIRIEYKGKENIKEGDLFVT
ncbi:hypothetical protein Tco_1150085 [Tanacetum coccineum]